MKIINLSLMDFVNIQVALLTHAKEWVKSGRKNKNQEFINLGLEYYRLYKKIEGKRIQGECY